MARLSSEGSPSQSVMLLVASSAASTNRDNVFE